MNPNKPLTPKSFSKDETREGSKEKEKKEYFLKGVISMVRGKKNPLIKSPEWKGLKFTPAPTLN